MERGGVGTSDTNRGSEAQPAISTYIAIKNHFIWAGIQQGHMAELKSKKIKMSRKFTPPVLASHSHRMALF